MKRPGMNLVNNIKTCTSANDRNQNIKVKTQKFKKSIIKTHENFVVLSLISTLLIFSKN